MPTAPRSWEPHGDHYHKTNNQLVFLSPTRSELKTSGPHPKIPSPQAQPAMDPADTFIEEKEGLAPGVRIQTRFSIQPLCLCPWPSLVTTASCSSIHPLCSRTQWWDKHTAIRVSPPSVLEGAGWGGRNTLLFLSYSPSLLEAGLPFCPWRRASPGPARYFISEVIRGNYWREGPWRLQPKWKGLCFMANATSLFTEPRSEFKSEENAVPGIRRGDVVWWRTALWLAQPCIWTCSAAANVWCLHWQKEQMSERRWANGEDVVPMAYPSEEEM